jgi:hypothetical protein
LVENLRADSAYRQTVFPSYRAAVATLFANSRRASSRAAKPLAV